MVSREEKLALARDSEFLSALVVELLKRPDLMKMIAEVALGRVATREDLEKVKGRLMEEIGEVEEKLRAEIVEIRREVGELQDQVSRVEGQLMLLIRLSTGFMAPMLLAIILILLKLFFFP